MPAAAPFVVLIQGIALDCLLIAGDMLVAWLVAKMFERMRAAAK